MDFSLSKSPTVHIPADVPKSYKKEYSKNYLRITKGTNRLMVFAGDQKMEHLNDDFFDGGKNIHLDDSEPEHLFRIASTAVIGAFAAQFALIAKYGRDYRKIPYIVKMNSKTNLVKTTQAEPFSGQLHTVQQVIEMKKNADLDICGVGYTIYLGSERDSEQFRQAAQLIYEAHQYGLVAILWIYPRGKAVKDEKDPHLIAGAAGVACCLGADFVKVNFPEKKGLSGSAKYKVFNEAVKAAGRTKVICAGGSHKDPRSFLENAQKQITIGGSAGNATGRNIHQYGLKQAVNMCNALSAITFANKDVDYAMKVFEGKERFHWPPK